jgi:Flp pilus assembly protein TadG
MNAQKTAPNQDAKRASLFQRIRVNKAGNTIAMTAAAIFPLAGMVGGAVDASRMYAVKSRLQSACDAAGLAGRRTMGGGAWNANSNAAATMAARTFDLNFTPGSFGSENLARSFTENSGIVSGTASANVPMTLMRIFNKPTTTITVACESQMRIPNTDVMFVLDTTGSMASAIPGDPTGTSKIDGLKSAVKCFYQDLAKRNLGELCGNPTGWVAPDSGVGNAVQLRFGFVPYTTNVNVGKLLPTSMMADQWTYQSRSVVTGQVQKPASIGAESPQSYGAASGGPSNWNNWGTGRFSNPSKPTGVYPDSIVVGSGACPTKPGNHDVAQGAVVGPVFSSRETVVYPDALQTTDYSSTQIFKTYEYAYNKSSGTCTLYRRSSKNWTQSTPSQTTRPIIWTLETVGEYQYKPVQHNIAGLKSGASWNNSVTLPLANLQPEITDANGDTFRRPAASTAATVSWDGCIEERQTFRNTDGDPTDDWNGYDYPSNDPMTGALSTDYDLNVDLTPSSGRAETYWGPALEDAVWGRYDGGGNTTAMVQTDVDLSRNNSYYCPREGRLLQTWGTPSTFESYVDSLYADGNTYHDIGLLWGWRLLSPTGIFAGNNAFTPAGGSIQRHMIFMTDGDTVTSSGNYTAYGVGWWDRRQTIATSAPSSTLLTSVVDSRMDALCREIKNSSITVWVVSYGSGVSVAAINRLRSCATDSSKFFNAGDTASLRTAFSSIAQQISDLRLTN